MARSSAKDVADVHYGGHGVGPAPLLRRRSPTAAQRAARRLPSPCSTALPPSRRSTAPRAPAPPAHPRHAPPSHALSRHSHTPCHPRSRAFTLFTPQPQPFSARQVFDSLSVRDGTREEEGKGSCGREARSQADSSREGGREGRDGGQGRRGAGITPCSSVRDQGAASQG